MQTQILFLLEFRHQSMIINDLLKTSLVLYSLPNQFNGCFCVFLTFPFDLEYCFWETSECFLLFKFFISQVISLENGFHIDFL